MTFEKEIIDKTVDRLIVGDDYRNEVVQAINARFFDFTIDFFKRIVSAKIEATDISLDWYKANFINNSEYKASESAVYAGLNAKTVQNIYGTSCKKIMLSVANDNLDYLSNLIDEISGDANDGLAISIKISHNDVTVDLSLSESLIVINALATKKLQIRGGAWSSIGKRVEKPLIDRLCAMSKVPAEYIDNTHFKKSKNKDVDREIDYKLKSRAGKWYKIEVKLMGKGNPESADMTIARDTEIFVADTLSAMDCNQLQQRNVKYLQLKGNNNVLEDFKKILDEMDIPHEE